MENEIATLIANIGFPIVAFYLMYKLVTNQMKENTDAIRNNTNIMSKIVILLEHLKGVDIDGDDVP